MMAASQEKIKSLLLKVGVYCDFYKKNRPPEDYPAGLREGAAGYAAEGKLTSLRYLSKELDVRVREILNENEQRVVVQSMLDAGVDVDDLVNFPTMKKLKNIIKKNALKGRDDYELARWGISVGEGNLLNPDEFLVLGSLLDKYEVSPPRK